MSDGDLPHSFTVPARVLRRLIDRTLAMSTEETRYYLNGLYFHAADSDGVEVLRIVATDGHRLRRSKCRFRKAAGHARCYRAAQDRGRNL